jgi:hypothetical protein
MSEQYSHTLISKPKDFVPSPSQVGGFLTNLLSLGVFGTNPAITLRVPTGTFREYPFLNPFTGERVRVEVMDNKRLESLAETHSKLESLGRYELELDSVGRPMVPPLNVAFEKPYHLGVICYVYSDLHSTSDLHSESGCRKAVPRYRQSEPSLPNVGYFSHPKTLKIIEVPHAGCARFWLEFQLGKFLLPEFSDGNLDMLNPTIVAEAENAFGIDFAQGCYWA